MTDSRGATTEDIGQSPDQVKPSLLPADLQPGVADLEHGAVRLRQIPVQGLPSLPVRETRSRRLPGFRIWRLPRFGYQHTAQTATRYLTALADAAQRNRRLIRCRVQLLAEDPETLASLEQAARAAGFNPATSQESYSRSLLIDLRTDSADALLQNLGATARRHIRAAGKNGFLLKPLTDPALAASLAAMERATRARTGGGYALQDWKHWLGAAASHPESVRIAALIDPDAADEGAGILAVALGVSHGDHVEYRAAATVPRHAVRVPLGYGPAWELLRWGHATGHRWFDFGGITGDDSPLAGISHFKRRFGGRECRVATEVLLEPQKWIAGLERGIGRLRDSLRRA